ncbi:MAG: glycoside hydrolase 5 family protein [Armatimonadota bacterium]
MKYTGMTALILGIIFLSSSCVNASKVIFLDDSFPQSSKAFSSTLKQNIIKAGFTTETVDGEHLAERLAAESGQGSILVMPNAKYLPVYAKVELQSFLKRGNHLFAISGPALSSPLAYINGKWINRDGIKQELAKLPGQKVLDFKEIPVSAWDRNAGLVESPLDIKIEPSGNTQVPDALHMKISMLDKWDFLLGKNIPISFPKDHTVTIFWAKGGPDTPELAVEWREKDGTRWFSSVKLTTEWKRYALIAEDFRFWGDGAPPNRGGVNDKLNTKNIDTISIGIGEGLSKQKQGIPHEFWISDIRSAKDESDGLDFTPPIIESLSPHYKTHNTHAYQIKDSSGNDLFISDTDIVAPVPRPLGLGSDSLRKWRQIPVLDAYDKSGEKRGIAAHLFLNNAGDYTGSIWGYAGFSQDYLEQNYGKVIPTIIGMLKHMDNGLFLANAGTEHMAYTDGEKIKLGAYIVNYGAKPVNLNISFIITNSSAKPRTIGKKVVVPAKNIKTPIKINAGSISSLSPGEYRVITKLMAGDRVIDTIDYPINVIKYKPLDKKDIVTTKGSDFYLNGKKWYPVGVNYWPRGVTGNEEPSDWLFWLEPQLYNPDIVEEDLALAEKLKMNVMSIAYYKQAESRPLMDFLARAQKHGIKIHMYMPGLHPIWQYFDAANKMIKAAHLPESPAFFAYDVGWEVHIGNYDTRKAYDKDWNEWIIDRYGSIENGVKDWGFKPETVDGLLTGAKDEQLVNDGEWRIFVAAYRRFWDDRISKGYQQVRNNIKSVDKHHLMGARSGWAGLGSMWAVPNFPFDLFSGAKHLDFTSPEGYTLYGDRNQFLEGGFDNAYCSFSGAGKPIFWVEYAPAVAVGLSNLAYVDHTPDMLEQQREYYENMIRMTFETFSNGSAGWWWPAGTRFEEHSDLGIINADGTPRPAAYEIAKANWFHTPREFPVPNFFIDVDRDKYVTGYAGLRADNVRKYVDAFLKGKIPAIRTAGVGTTSANTPLVAVGNVPYNRHNPMKFLNAEFNYLKINGKVVKDGSIITVKRGKPILVEASIGNTAEATWLAPTDSNTGGKVFLNIHITPQVSTQLPIKADTPFLKDAKASGQLLIGNNEVVCTFQMTAIRADFGEVIRVTIKPE